MNATQQKQTLDVHLSEAQKALDRGDKLAARTWACRAAQIAPDQEAPWLVLADIASPRASVEYLRRALEINPGSLLARKRIHGAVKRLREETYQAISPPVQTGGPAALTTDTIPHVVYDPDQVPPTLPNQTTTHTWRTDPKRQSPKVTNPWKVAIQVLVAMIIVVFISSASGWRQLSISNTSALTCPPYANTVHQAIRVANAAAALCGPDNLIASLGLVGRPPSPVLVLDMGLDNQFADGPGTDFYYYERRFLPGILMDKVEVAVAQDDGTGNPGAFTVLFVWGDDDPDNNGTIPPTYLPESSNKLINRSDLHLNTGIGIDIGNDNGDVYRFVRFRPYPPLTVPQADEVPEVDAVEGVYHVPVLSPVGNQTVPLGSSLSLVLSASDADGDTIAFGATPLPLPAGASLNRPSGAFSFKPNATQVGTVEITFFASDESGGIDSETVTITVAGPEPGTATALTGRLLDTNDFVQGLETPVVGATVSLLDTDFSAISDDNGTFTLADIPSGSQILDINTSTANTAPNGAPYAGFREEIELIENVTNVVERPFFLPQIAVESLTPVDPNNVTIVTNPTLATTMTVPPNTAKAEDGTNFTGELSISEVAEGLAPAALPDELDPGLLITIQPVGVTFSTPVPVTFPNIDDLPPGSEAEIWSLDAATGTFMVVGIGQVSADGARIETISGGIRAADWHMALPPNAAGEDTGDDCEACEVSSGSQTAVASGNLRVEHELVSYFSLNQPQALRLVYNSLHADPHPIIAARTTVPRRAAVPPTISFHLTVAGIDQGGEVFVNTSGLNESQDETFLQAVQLDASRFPTGAYPYQLAITSNYRRSSVSSFLVGEAVVNNQQNSSFGAGWTLDGLQRLHMAPNESVLITEGDGSNLHFTRVVPLESPVNIVEPGWILRRMIRFDGAQAAHYNPRDGLLYVGHRAPPPAADGLYHVDDIGLVTKVADGDRLAAVAVSPDSGDIFFAEDFGGAIFRTAFASTGRSTWVSGLHSGDDDPVGMAIAPENYTGSVLNPGEALVVDRGFNGPDEVWRFSPDTAEGEMLVHSDDGTLIDPVDITIGLDEVYLADNARTVAGNESGRIYRLDADGSLNLLSTLEPIEEPNGITTDPLTQDLFVLDATGERLVRVNPATGTVSDMFTGFSVPGNAWAGVDVTPDGQRIIITDRGTGMIYTFARADAEIEAFQSPPGDFSTLVQNEDGTFTRILRDGTQIHFNLGGLHTSTVDRNGNATTYNYDTADRLMTITDPVGQVTTFSYINSLLATITDPAGRITTFTHDAAGNLLSITDPDGSSEQFGYDARHHLTTQTAKRGFTTHYEYNFAGQHVQSALPDGSSRQILPSVTNMLIDPSTGLGTANNPAPLVRETEVIATYMDGEDRSYLYDTGVLGRAERFTDAAGLSTEAQLDPNGNIRMVSLPSGHTVQYGYDSNGNRVITRDAVLGSDVSWSYAQPFNLLTSFTDTEGNVTEYVYDGPNLDHWTSPLGQTMSYSFDFRGNVTSTTDPMGTETTFVYDAFGNLRETHRGTAANERVELIARTDEGYVRQLTDPLGRVTSFTYDTFGRPATQMLPDGRVITTTYDMEGNVISITPPGRPPHTFSYTANNQLEVYTPPDIGAGNSETRYEYNAAQQLIEIIRPDGQSITIDYDVAGRRATVTIPDESLTFTYDPLTGLLRTTTGLDGGLLTYSYNGQLLNEMEWAAGEVGGRVFWTHNADYRVDSLTVEGTPTISYSYDADGLLERAGALIITRAPSTGLAMAATLGSVTETWGYNDFGEPDSFVATHDGSVLYETVYLFDAGSRVEQKTELIDGSRHTFVYTYDLAGRLEQVTRDGLVIEAYSYDLNDNRLTQVGPAGTITGTYDNQDRLTEYGTTTYTYTDNGELLTKTNSAGMTTYDYDVLGNLRSVSLPDGTDIEYVVDGRNRRIGKGVNGTLVQGFLYKDDLNPIAELNGNNQIISVFVYGSRPNVPDYMIRDGHTYRILSDRLGSPRLVVNVATGEVVARMDYDAFGNVVTNTNPGFQPFGFAGGLYDGDTNLTRFGARDYDAQIGRWTAKDPSLLLNGQTNLYTYVANDPINNVDLEGYVGCLTTMDCFCMRRPAECAAIAGAGASAGRALASGGVRAVAASACLAVILTIESDTPRVRPLDPVRAVPLAPTLPPPIISMKCELVEEAPACTYKCPDGTFAIQPSGPGGSCRKYYFPFPGRF